MDLNTRIKTTSAASDHGTNSIFTSSSIFYAFFLRIKLLKCEQCLFYLHKINKILSVVKKVTCYVCGDIGTQEQVRFSAGSGLVATFLEFRVCTVDQLAL